MVLLAYIIYAMMVVIFAFFYVLYGCVLYVLGPLVLALLPMAGVGQLAKSYATNLMIWNAWGILYATFGSLITAIQFNRVDEVMNQGFLQGFFRGIIRRHRSGHGQHLLCIGPWPDPIYCEEADFR